MGTSFFSPPSSLLTCWAMPKRRAQVNTREAKPAKSMRTVREAARTGDAAVDKRNAKRLLYDASQGSGGKLAGVHRPPALQLARRDPARTAVEAEAQRPLHRSTRSRHQTPLPRHPHLKRKRTVKRGGRGGGRGRGRG